jgi:uncharacterized protein (TIGR02646 family)
MPFDKNRIINEKLFEECDHSVMEKLINLPCSGQDKWKNPDFQPIYSKIKNKLLEAQDKFCFYCHKQHLNIDADDWHIDHIIPIDEDDRFVFTEFNLILACKWCNRRKNDKPVLTEKPKTNRCSKSSSKYRIIHARIDDYFEHIDVIGDIFYSGKTPKGRRTIYDCVLDRFKLEYISNLKSNDRDFVDGALKFLMRNGKDEFIRFIKSLPS